VIAALAVLLTGITRPAGRPAIFPAMPVIAMPMIAMPMVPGYRHDERPDRSWIRSGRTWLSSGGGLMWSQGYCFLMPEM
jgi:hypothetical protein